MDYSRQREVFDVEKFTTPVHVVGCGATGSWVAVLLAKLGITNVTLHDFDTVEPHNLPNQMFAYTDIGDNKAVAMQNMMFYATGMAGPQLRTEAVTGETKLDGIVFLLTDTMYSRSDIFNKALKYNVSVPLLIETRMCTEGGRVYAINPSKRSDIVEYSKTLYSDEDSAVSDCGIAQSLAPSAAMLASLAVWQLIKYHNGWDIDGEIILDAKSNTWLTRSF